MIGARARWAIASAFTLGLAVLSLAPLSGVPTPRMIPHADKAAHVALYAVYAALILVVLFPGRRDGKTLAWVVLYCSAFGALMEVLQAAFPGLNRTGEVADALANAVGAALAAVGIGLARRRKRLKAG